MDIDQGSLSFEELLAKVDALVATTKNVVVVVDDRLPR